MKSFKVKDFSLNKIATSKEFEQELESALEDYREKDTEQRIEIEQLQAQVRELRRGEELVERLQVDIAKLQEKYKREVTMVEKECEGLRKRISEAEK